MPETIEFPEMSLLHKYNTRGSFYTDYPALGLWQGEFSDKEYRESILELGKSSKDSPVFFYHHFPFCRDQCYYCMCFSKISKNHKSIKEFLGYNEKEVDLFRQFSDKNGIGLNIKKVHLGGGSPSYMDYGEFDKFLGQLSKIIDFKGIEEFAIEVDPRSVNPEKMRYYHEKGIDRISFGVQEFDINVQKAINRIQPVEMVEELMAPDLRQYFKSINFDIIYGLPRQTRESFSETIEHVVRLSPDRMGVCILGWRPDIFKHQRKINESELPSFEESNLMNFDAIERLSSAGYERIGIDHFAKSTENLAVAKKEKKLHRSAMGYNPGDCIEAIGLGPSGMNRILNYYFQRAYNLSDYYSAIDSGKFPIFRGHKLDRDAEIRRDLMEKVICYDGFAFKDIENAWDIDFKNYFSEDLSNLKGLTDDGIVKVNNDSLTVTPIGKFFHRHVCAAFDNLLRKGVTYKHARDTA